MSAITILNAVQQRLKAQEATAIATLEMCVNNSMAIADHSDIVGEVEKQVRLLTEAKECLAVLDSIMPKPATTTTPVSTLETGTED